MPEKDEKRLTPVYFILTALFALVMPNAAFFTIGFVCMVLAFMGVGFSFVLLFVLPIVDFVLMLLWGRFMTIKLKTPKTLVWKYFPVLIPVFWHTTVGIVCAVVDPQFIETEMGALVSCNLVGGLFSIMELSTVAAYIIQDVIVTAGFTIGERAAARKSGIKHKAFGIKSAGIIAACAAVVIGVGSIAEWYADLGRADYSEADFLGHGFNYEHGWSSVNLEPYYVENSDNMLAKLSEPSELTITGVENMPSLDGAEAAYPVYSAFAAACYEDIAKIQTDAKAAHKMEDYYRDSDASFADMPVRFTNTVRAFEKLIEGDVDIFFGAKPSAEQYEMAKNAGKELVLTPIGKEAFVFFVNEGNPIDGLTSEQIRRIYSGEYTRWSDVGGELIPILAFQRPENSGSQTMMVYFMGDTPLKEPIKSEYEASMIGVIKTVASYQNKRSAIGYSFRYYATGMSGGTEGIKLLSLDGAAPDKENILSGAYPMTTSLYAITLADNKNENVRPMLDWITGAQGQKIVEETGYVPVGGE